MTRCAPCIPRPYCSLRVAPQRISVDRGFAIAARFMGIFATSLKSTYRFPWQVNPAITAEFKDFPSGSFLSGFKIHSSRTFYCFISFRVSSIPLGWIWVSMSTAFSSKGGFACISFLNSVLDKASSDCNCEDSLLQFQFLS